MEKFDLNIQSYLENVKSSFKNVYPELVKTMGLKSTWDFLISKMSELPSEEFSLRFFSFSDVGYYYELGLAIVNKVNKKNAGKYFTPQDVSNIMAEYFSEFKDVENIADVGCGCGNLIFAVLSKNIKFSKIYLYDIDPLALKIAKIRIIRCFNIKPSKIVCLEGDFLSEKFRLPKNCFVITNPPYLVVKTFDKDWNVGEGFKESKDLYIGFLEKIASQSKGFVSVNPQSFLCGHKFLTFRKKLGKQFSGKIFAFDNVPATLFNGKKLGVFNTNNANGVRASIIVATKNDNPGFRLSHLIRFKTSERKKVLQTSFLENTLGTKTQNLVQPLKCFKELEDFVFNIKKTSKSTINNLIVKESDFNIYVSSSARYFISASVLKQKRNGLFSLCAKDYRSFIILYALLNSSYVYLWWRMKDGGIMLPKSLVLNTPLPDLPNSVFSSLEAEVKGMIKEEANNLSYKLNAGVYQETVKIPKSRRDIFNNILFPNINFKKIHSNSEF